MELVQSYARNVIVLNHGEIMGQGPTSEMMKNVEVLKKARVLPAQIPELTLRFGDEFKDVFTVEEMLDALRKKAKKGGQL